MGNPLLVRTALGLAVLLALPAVADAFSLGDIRVRTPFGEPFQAEISLTLHPDEEARGVEAVVADGEAYQRLKLSRDLVVTHLRTRLEGKGVNRRILLSSDIPLRTPFFNLLLKTLVGVGSHYRNYPVFLEIRPTKEDGSDHAASGRRTYGPVRAGESLASIARQIPPLRASLAQKMVALWSVNKNRHSFDNMNELPVGLLLDLPTQEEVTRLSVAAAAQVLDRQRQARHKEVPVQPKGAGMVPATLKKPVAAVQPQPVPGVALSDRVAENQPLTASANKTGEPLELLSKKLTETTERSLRNEATLASLGGQLTEMQARLNLLEQKSAVLPVAAPSPAVVPARTIAPPPTMVADPTFSGFPWMEYGVAGVVGSALAFLLVWLRRKKAAPTPEVPVESGDRMAQIPMKNPPSAEGSPPLPSVCLPVLPVFPPVMADPIPTPVLLAPVDREIVPAPVDREIAPAPVAELADESAIEIAGEEEEESIFRNLLESSPALQGQEDAPRVVDAAGLSGLSSGFARLGGEEPLEMFELNGSISGAMARKTVSEPTKETIVSKTDPTGEGVLEWVLDET